MKIYIYTLLILLLLNVSIIYGQETAPLEILHNAINTLYIGDTREAVILYEKAITADPLLLSENDNGLMNLLIRSYQNALRLHPEDFFLLYKLGVRYMLAGMNDKAIVELEAYIRAMSSNETEAVKHARLLVNQLKKQKSANSEGSSSDISSSSTSSSSTSPFAELDSASGTENSQPSNSSNSSSNLDDRRDALQKQLEEKQERLEEMKERQKMYQGLEYTTSDGELSTTYNSLYYLYNNQQNSVQGEIDNLQNQLDSMED